MELHQGSSLIRSNRTLRRLWYLEKTMIYSGSRERQEENLKRWRNKCSPGRDRLHESLSDGTVKLQGLEESEGLQVLRVSRAEQWRKRNRWGKVSAVLCDKRESEGVKLKVNMEVGETRRFLEDEWTGRTITTSEVLEVKPDWSNQPSTILDQQPFYS